MEAPAVELRNISKAYRSDRRQESLAVDNINLQIAKSEFFSILGPSGCGKTTTLRIIAGFEIPTSGEVYIHGQAMGNSPPFHRPVNTVFQSYALFPHLTVAENVAFGLEMENLGRSQIRDRATETLALVKLTGMEKRYPRQLSGGQQQRVALARALVKQPGVLLFDEPLGALDLKLRKEMQLELKHMQQRLGITFVYVTHDQEEALTMSDRIAVMYAGRVCQVGTPIEIYEEPSSRFVAEFIGETNFLLGRMVERRATGVVVLVEGGMLLLVSGGQDLEMGQVVTLVVRPEKVAIYPESYGARECLSGVVKEVIYIGTDTRYAIDIAGNSTIIARRQNRGPERFSQFAVGETVKVRVHPDSIRIISEDLPDMERVKVKIP